MLAKALRSGDEKTILIRVDSAILRLEHRKTA